MNFGTVRPQFVHLSSNALLRTSISSLRCMFNGSVSRPYQTVPETSSIRLGQVRASPQDLAPSSSFSPQALSQTMEDDLINDFGTDKRPVILYDGVCNLCNNAVNFMLDNDPSGNFRLAALQSPAGRRLLRSCGRSPDDISSIVLVEWQDQRGQDTRALSSGPSAARAGSRDSTRVTSLKHYIKSEAVLRIAAGLPNGFPLLAMFGIPFPLFIRDPVYDLVADNRYSILGKRTVCRLSDDRFEGRFIV